jgi:hypothetical protein
MMESAMSDLSAKLPEVHELTDVELEAITGGVTTIAAFTAASAAIAHELYDLDYPLPRCPH